MGPPLAPFAVIVPPCSRPIKDKPVIADLSADSIVH
jgi:hypothetical protein